MVEIQIERIVLDMYVDHKRTGTTFCNRYFSSVLERRNLLSEFYIHNYLFHDNTDWNSNHFIGDVNLKAFLSILENEIKTTHAKELCKG
jgi:hypothetical protein